MNVKDFLPEAPGRVITTLEGHSAFVPNPLPPNFNLNRGSILLLGEASTALGELNGLGQRLPNPHLLISPFLRREAMYSSRIEGTIATAQELLLFEALPEEEPPKPDVREVANYVRALEHGLQRLRQLPVSLRLLREMHSILMHGVRGQEKRPGEFRNIQNFIAQPHEKIENARFVPPPPNEMSGALDDLEKYLHRNFEWPFLIELALIHYQFESIHPFTDGNGRIGRLLISLLLCSEKHLRNPLLYLSAYFEKNRSTYYDLLLAVSQKGKWLEWVEFFLQGVKEQSRDAMERSQRLLRLWEDYRRRMQKKPRASALVLRLVDELFSYPAITPKRAQALLRVTPRSALLNIEKLVEAGVLRELTGRKRNRVYFASEIIDTIESENPQG